ncbi:MAG TPA: hydrogenase subunit MbhD domain-containing protein [Spirochaetia bacterium]|nr:hydrogenase subunit MbhD domain-containing protein [Spirochaetia bacterium]
MSSVEIFIIPIGLFMIAGAIIAIYQKNLVAAIVSSGVVSLVASVIYIVLAAPDVAMTEAAIGSALTTVVFLYALSRIRRQGGSEND